MEGQFSNIRIKRNSASNNELVHIAYYDKATKSIHYSVQYGNHVYSPGDDGDWYCYSNSWVNIDGGSDYDDTHNYNGELISYDYQSGAVYKDTAYTDGASILIPNTQFASTSTKKRAEATAPFLDIALTSQGMPVIVYADVDSTIRVARANTTFARGSGKETSWTIQEIMSPSDPNYNAQNIGYLACEIDNIDNKDILHIVFTNALNELVYIKSGLAQASGGAYEFGTSEIIAPQASKMDMYIKGSTPYVSYITSVGSADGLCLAFFDSTLDLNGDGTKGDWETMAAPLTKRINDVRTSVVVNPTPSTSIYNQVSTCWEAAIGYTPGDFYRVAFYIGTGKGH
jgi:hypothetical protein